MNLRLHDGDRVCIVGGGPAGSCAALHLLALAEVQHLRLEVLIFEPHQAATLGPKGCKGCAGILSDGAVRNLATLGLELPASVIQSELRSYVVHVAGQVTTITQPDPRRRIVNVYRGAGPRLHRGAPLSGLDAYLLAQACERGARLIPERVRQVAWEDGPVVYTDDGRFPAAFLVLATGVNSRSPLSPAFGYAAPDTVAMVQDEVPRPANWPPDKVAGFFDQPPGLVFGAVVPKGAYLSVSLLWRDGSATDAIQQFYHAQAGALRHFFPDWPESLCGCNPRIVSRPSSHYYGDRWVAVGDAVVARLYKDGINSAFLTSQRAMQTAVTLGIDGNSFRTGYAPFCRQIAVDNRYGAMLYKVASHALQNALLAAVVVECVRAEAHLPLDKRVHARLMWGMLTGDETYAELFRLSLQPRGLLSLSRGLWRTLRRGPVARPFNGGEPG